MTYPNVRVYSKPNCVQCNATMRWLDLRDVEYDVVDLTESEDDLAAVVALGYSSAPVVAVADDVHWSGFQPEMLALHCGVS